MKAISVQHAALRKTALQANSDALADVPRGLAANTAWLHGHTIGGDMLDTDTPNVTPRSPMHGRRGHTHTGGVDGRPLYQTLAVASLGDNSHTSGLRAHGVTLGKIYAASVNPDTIIRGKIPAPILCWIPGCDPGLDVGSYAFVGVAMQIEGYVDANLGASDTLSITIRNTTETSVASSTFDVGITASPWSGTFSFVSDATAERVATFPGRMNRFEISWVFTTVGGALLRTIGVEIQTLEFGVYGDLAL
jgi:hypothetical protein